MIGWNVVESEIAALVLTGEYYTPEPMEEIADEVIAEEPTDELDDFAIPDEVDDMGIPDNVRAEESDAVIEDPAEAIDAYKDVYSAADDTIPEESVEADESDIVQSHNFHLDIWDTKSGGAKTRYAWKVKAIKTLKKVEDEGRSATQEEQQS